MIKEGLSGESLLQAFRNRQKEIRHSVEAMLKDAKKVAEGKASYYTLQEVFGEKGEK